MSQHHSRRLKVAAIWAVIVIAGAIAGWLSRGDREAGMRARLIDDARRSSMAFERAELDRLAGLPEDRNTPGFASVRERLQRLAAVDSRVRTVFILRTDSANNRITYVASSAASNTARRPGDPYLPAAGSAGLRDLIQRGEPATAGPVANQAGTWITAYAGIGDPASGPDTEAEKYILGLDVDAASWARELWQAAFQGAFYAWIVLGLPFVALLVTRRQGEQREVIRNLSEAMEQSHSAILIVDLEGRIEYANRGLCQEIGYSRRELIGRKWKDFHVPQTDDAVISEMFAMGRAGRTWEGEWFNPRKDGSVYPVRGVVTPVKHRDGSLACFVAVFEDVTETKQREAELREARDLAEAGDRAKGHFLATMSHEVRTPLNGIVGFTSLLLDTPLTPEQREYVQTIRMSTEALIQLTGDILDFARIESGKLNLDPLACDPRECVEDALDLLAAKAAEKGLELLHRVGPDVPAAILIDGGRLRQVLVNLVGNAVKFTARGEVEVSLTLGNENGPEHGTSRSDLNQPNPDAAASATATATEDENSGRQARNSTLCTLKFTVRDTGIGIAPEHHAKLFRPFTQVDESTTRRYGGTGLGLAICQNLVTLMGGEIGVTSEAGRGSTFSFTVRAPVAAPKPPDRQMPGCRVGLAVPSGALRRELVQLLEGWKASVIATAMPEQLDGGAWDAALVEVCEDTAHELAVQEMLPGLAPERTFGLVPVSLSNDLRTALRAHFRLLINKPVRHDALFMLLSGAQPHAVEAPAPTRFGFRVLVVEDNVVNQRLVARVLENLSCKPTLVENGRKALEILRARADEYDLILLDLHMPEMDGLTTLREIRSGNAGSRAQTMWIIALTADAREQQRARGMAEGLNDYLTKPMKLADLENALRRFRTERMTRKR